MTRSSEPAWVRQRHAILDAIEIYGPVGYVHKDGVTGTCWLCGAPLGVRFKAMSVQLICVDGCDEADLAATLFGEVV